MRDALGREISYLRVSVTDRCNLRCVYCMPPSGVHLVSHEDILSVEETVRLTSIITGALGIKKIRITGGEPLVRKGVTEIIRGISGFGIPELTLTTNGLLLGVMAGELADAGIQRVNVSLDSLRDRRIEKISRRRVQLTDIESGIGAASTAGLSPVKVNCVIMRGWNDDEIVDFLEWGHLHGLTVRFIEHMPSILTGDVFMSRDEILERASVLGKVECFDSSDSTSGYYSIDNRGILFGIVAPYSDQICGSCNRIRLSAEGVLYTCLASGNGTPLKQHLRLGSDETLIGGIVRKAVLEKPDSHGGCVHADMWKIGG